MKKVRHIGIVVADLKKSLRFYQNFLGFKPIKEMTEQGNFIDKILGLKGTKVKTIKLKGDGETLIELLYYYSESDRLEANEIFCPGYSHFALTVNDLNQKYQKLKNQGIEFVSEPQVSPDGGVKVVFCRDFEGNYLELVEELSSSKISRRLSN